MEKGAVAIGLLITIIFIISIAVFSAPNFSITNQVAFAYNHDTDGGGGSGGSGGGGGGGVGGVSRAVLAGGSGGAGTVFDEAVEILRRIAQSTPEELAADGTTGLVRTTTQAVSAIAILSEAGLLNRYRGLAIDAVKQLLIGLLIHAISIIQQRLVDLGVSPT